MQAIAQQQETAAAALKLEKSRFLPDLSLAYGNASIRGVGADERFYTGSTRFNTFQVGVGIPVFAGAQQARVKSARLNQQIAMESYRAGLQHFTTDYLVALARYRQYQEVVSAFEARYLKNADLIDQTANKQLVAGTINYLEWVQVSNQALSIRNEYTEAVKNLNDAIIQLNYLVNK